MQDQTAEEFFYRDAKIKIRVETDRNQCEKYLVQIIGNDGSSIPGRYSFSDYDEALEDSKKSVDRSLDGPDPNAVNFTQNVWLRSPNKRNKDGSAGVRMSLGKQVLLACLVFFVTGVLAILLPNQTAMLVYFLLWFICMVAGMLYLILILNKSNFTTFLLEDGYLYRLEFINLLRTEANLFRVLQLEDAGFATAFSGMELSAALAKRVNKTEQLMKFSDKSFFILWKILSISKIKQTGNTYRISCRIYDCKTDKEKNKTFHVRNDYIDFDTLMKCFQILKK